MEHGDLYRQIVGSFADGVVALGLDGTIRFANPSAEALLGAGDLRGRHVHEFLDVAGRLQSSQHLARAAEGVQLDDEVDTMFVRPDGSHRWVRLRQTGLLDGDRVGAVVLRLTDNHRTKHLLEEISTSRERLARAERIARSGSWTWDARQGRASYSEGLHELYGDGTEDLLSPDRDRLLDLTHPADHQSLLHCLGLLFRGDEPSIDLEVRQRGRDGWMWVRLRAQGARDPDGSLAEVSGTCQDITRSRDTEEQLRDMVAQNSLMQAVATAANEAATLDEVLVRAGSLIVVHDEWDRARVFVPAADGSGLVPHLAEQREELEEGFARVERDKVAALEQETAEACYRLGEVVWDAERRLTVAFPVRLHDEILAVGTMTSLPPLYRHDLIHQMLEQAAPLLSRVAERERARQLLGDARDRAIEASQHKSDFLATMSHEIRTPLNGIIGLNELLDSTGLTDRQQHLVNGIAVSSRSLLDLINDVLDFSKIEAGRLDVESVDFEVREVLAEVGDVLAESARAREIELEVSCSPDVPDLLAGDPTRLRQVLLNLGSNAVKFTTTGSVRIRATATPEAGSPDRAGDPARSVLRVEVHDTGMGVPLAQQRQIFAPFSQADTSTTRRFGGTGLGLAISAEIVAAFDGEIGVRSEPGEGSTFWFTARLGAATGSLRDSPSARARRTLGDTRILVVDDKVHHRTILHEQLGWWDVSSTGVEDSATALGVLAAATTEGDPFDAVLVDLDAPGRDGGSLVDAVRQAGYPAGLPLILLTSSFVPAGDLRSAGLTACLTKPVPSSTLRELLLATLAAEPEAGPTDPPPPTPTRHGRVLVVEDNAINQLVARGFLEAQGYVVETAEDGEAALAMVADGGYDAVLMDVQMPRLDGYDTTRALRRKQASTGRGDRLPIVAVTAAAVAGEREKCLAAGMDDFITKPVSATALAAALARWIPGSGGPAASTPVSRDGPPDPHLDLDRLGQLLELGPPEAYLDRAIGNFLAKRAGVLDRLTRAVEDADPTALTACAHELRGSAGNLGLPVVTAIATDLETIGRAGSTATARSLLTDLAGALAAAALAISSYQDWYRSLPVADA